jgi:hypothetical protein
LILLPEIITADGEPGTLHYLITSDWEEMMNGGRWVKYQVSDAHYQ